VSAVLTVLHTNDLHGHLDEFGAAALARLKAELAPCLLLDSGDAVACGNVGWHRRGERLHELMNGAGYDAAALGNREFHFRPGPQAAKASLARFPLLCANLLAPPGYGGLRPAATLNIEGWPPIRVFGLLVPMVTDQMWARRLSPARFGPPAEAAVRVLASLDGALPLCLSHLGAARDRELAAACPSLPLILGGHSHTLLDPPERVGQTVITQNRPYGGSLTKVRLRLDAGRVVVESAEWLPFPSKGG
jgi:2',3'-cyclic-nucleotide 2'-phosphodiesterase (5'-nucleotidase family)